MTNSLAQPDYYHHPILGDASEYVRHMPYFQGAAFKHVLRAGNKPGTPTEHDLKKALECVHIINDKDIPTVVLRGDLLEKTEIFLQSMKPQNEEDNLFFHPDYWRALTLRELACGSVGDYTQDNIEIMLNLYKNQEQEEETE